MQCGVCLLIFYAWRSVASFHSVHNLPCALIACVSLISCGSLLRYLTDARCSHGCRRAGERQRGFKPPRFAVRGRGRGRSHIRGNHSLGSVNEHSDVERPGFDECGVMRLNGEINEMTADAVDVSEDVKAHRRVAGSSDDEECCHIGVQNGDRLSDRRQHRRDDLDGRDRFGGRDRVRTYGGRYRGYGRGRGRGMAFAVLLAIFC